MHRFVISISCLAYASTGRRVLPSHHDAATMETIADVDGKSISEINRFSQLITLLSASKPIASFQASLTSSTKVGGARNHKSYPSLQRVAVPKMVEPPAGVAIFGPGSNEIRLIAAKMAAKEGYAVSIIASAGVESQWRQWMYGTNYSNDGKDDPDKPQIRVGADQLGVALSDAKALIAVCDENTVPDGTVKTLLDNAPNIERVVLISKMGVTRAKPGPFGLGGGDAELLAGEERMRAETSKRSMELAIVRVGALKGGGPGRVVDGSVQSGEDLGLAKDYYNSLLDSQTAMVTQGHDNYVLGLKLSKGDPIDLPNPVIAFAQKSSWDPQEAETNRVVAGAAAVYALRHPTPVELSVSAEKGEKMPTNEEWEKEFSKL